MKLTMSKLQGKFSETGTGSYCKEFEAAFSVHRPLDSKLTGSAQRPGSSYRYEQLKIARYWHRLGVLQSAVAGKYCPVEKSRVGAFKADTLRAARPRAYQAQRQDTGD